MNIWDGNGSREYLDRYGNLLHWFSTLADFRPGSRSNASSPAHAALAWTREKWETWGQFMAFSGDILEQSEFLALTPLNLKSEAGILNAESDNRRSESGV